MALEFLLLVFVVIIGVFVVHKMLQEALDLVHIGVSLIGIILLVFMVAVAIDAISFKRTFSSSSNLIVVSGDSGVEFAGVLNGSSLAPLDNADSKLVSNYLSKKDYDSALGTYYKVITVKKDALPILLGNSSDLTQDPGLFISEYKTGGVSVYPETLVFKVIRYMPGKDFVDFFKGIYFKVVGLVRNEA